MILTAQGLVGTPSEPEVEKYKDVLVTNVV